MLADQEGVILSSWGAHVLPEAHPREEFSIGTRWDEYHQGTNAIGTALAERKAVTVLGRSHYLESAHSLACYAALIRHPLDGSVAVLDISGPVASANPLFGVLAESLAATLESALHVSVEERLRSGGKRLVDWRADGAPPPRRVHAPRRAGSGLILGTSLDYQETLDSIATLAVESLADWCLIDLLDGRPPGARQGGDGAPDKRAVVDGLYRYPISCPAATPGADAIDHTAPGHPAPRSRPPPRRDGPQRRAPSS